MCLFNEVTISQNDSIDEVQFAVISQFIRVWINVYFLNMLITIQYEILGAAEMI